MAQFTWIDTFEAITNKLGEFENKQEELISILRNIGIDSGLDDKNSLGETFPLIEIDPFTFFSLFMKYGIERRKILFAKLANCFGLSQFESPSDFDGVPSAPAQKVRLFPIDKNRSPDMIATLWQVFRNAKAGMLDDALFQQALAIPNTGYTKLTQCLFYAFPKLYFPIDSQTRPWLTNHSISPPDGKSWGEYQRCLSDIKKCTEKPYYELSYEAWASNQAPAFNALLALDYLEERYSGTRTGTTHIQAFRCSNGRQLALDPGKKPELKKKIALFIEQLPPNQEAYEGVMDYPPEKSRNGHLQQHAPLLASGHQAWSISVNSIDQLETLCNWYSGETATLDIKVKEGEINMERQPLNQILYGPPGTGKTYATTELSVKIADPVAFQNISSEADKQLRRGAIKRRYDELVEQKRIVFTTFHQSFAYEDFIEGIRATTNSETGQLRYDVEDGVFKQLCEAADSRATIRNQDKIDLDNRRIWKMSLGNTQEDDDSIFQECLEGGYVLLGWGGNIDFSGCTTRDAITKKLEASTGEKLAAYNYEATSVNTLRNVIRVGDLVVVSDGNHKFRAIGEFTGEYQFLGNEERDGYQQMRPVKWLTQYEPSLPTEQLFKKALSQMSLYELKPKSIDMDKLAVLLTPNPTPTGTSMPQPYVMIIDEINRGNISRIFGELITLLESGKRKGGQDARQVTLPYSKKPFSVPPNLYVIGTMNTADKSLAQLDLALRRRFSFVELPPSPDLLADITVHGLNIAQLLDVINQRIEVLLDRDHLLGHSYFYSLKSMKDAAHQETELARVFSENIIPLLQEYFFDDFERIGWVLNDPAKAISDRFIQQGRGRQVSELFTSGIAEQLTDRRYHINHAAFARPAAYQGIVRSPLSTGNEADTEL